MDIDIIVFLIFVNITSFFICLFDKYLAKKRKFRISEKIIIGINLIGGIFGFFIASRIFKHKTKDKKFRFCTYPILFIWIIIFFYFILC